MKADEIEDHYSTIVDSLHRHVFDAAKLDISYDTFLGKYLLFVTIHVDGEPKGADARADLARRVSQDFYKELMRYALGRNVHRKKAKQALMAWMVDEDGSRFGLKAKGPATRTRMHVHKTLLLNEAIAEPILARMWRVEDEVGGIKTTLDEATGDVIDTPLPRNKAKEPSMPLFKLPARVKGARDVRVTRFDTRTSLKKDLAKYCLKHAAVIEGRGDLSWDWFYPTDTFEEFLAGQQQAFSPSSSDAEQFWKRQGHQFRKQQAHRRRRRRASAWLKATQPAVESCKVGEQLLVPGHAFTPKGFQRVASSSAMPHRPLGVEFIGFRSLQPCLGEPTQLAKATGIGRLGLQGSVGHSWVKVAGDRVLGRRG